MRRKDVECLAGDVKEVHTLCHIGNDIGLRKHNALALAGGTRGKYDGCKTIGIDLVIVIGIVTIRELLAARLNEVGKSEVALVDGITVDADVELSLGVFLEVSKLAADLRAVEDGVGGSAVDGCGEVGCGHFLIKRNGNSTDSHQRKIGVDPSDACAADDGNLLVTQTESDLLCSEVADIVTRFSVSNADGLCVSGGLLIGNCGLIGEIFRRLLNHYSEITEHRCFVKRIFFVSVHYYKTSVGHNIIG